MTREKIFIQGYGFSGSSLIRDYLYEYEDVVHLETQEFNLCRSSGGIYELGLLIENGFLWSLDSFIHRYYQLINFLYDNGYRKFFGEKFLKISNEFIERIYVSKILANRMSFCPNEMLIQPQKKYKGVEKLFKKWLKKYNNKYFNEIRNVNFNKDIYFAYNMTHEEYVKIAKEYLDNFFNLFEEGKKIVLVHPTNIINSKVDTCLDYYDNYKMVIIEKDPRDVFAAMNTKVNPSPYLEYFKNVDNFIFDFIEARKFEEHNLNLLQDKVVKLTCEEFIKNYDEISLRLQDFLNLDKEKHTKRQTLFIPEKSAKFVGMYKNYANQDDIRKIEEKLEKYIIN